MILIDVHAHVIESCLDFPNWVEKSSPEKRIIEIVENCKKNNVVSVINNGTEPQSNRRILELFEKYKILKPSLGYYPTHAEKDGIEKVKKEIEFIIKNKKNVFAIGEIGLDFKETKTQKEKDTQIETFKLMLNLAEKLNVPAIIHSRKAEKEVLDVLEKSKYKKVVLHCFSGRKHLIERAYKMGLFFSIPTSVIKSEHFQRIVEIVNISKLLTETDTPFLSPFEDKQNEPSYVAETIKKIAEIKKMDKEEIANNIYMNYQRLFV